MGIYRYPGATLETDYRRIGDMLRDSMMTRGLMPIGLAIEKRAAATAPRSATASTARRGGKRYADSFGTHVQRGNDGRVGVRVFNSNWFALYIEYGNRNIPAHRVLRKAAGQTEFTSDKGVHGG